MMNYFDVLNVSIGAEPEVIKASYRALAKKYHPDSFEGGKEEAEKRMAQINEAYQVLADDFLRAEYIKKLKVSKTSTNSNTTYERGEQSSNSEFQKGNVARTKTSYRETDYEYNPEVDKYSNLFLKVIIFIIVVSVICCIIHFGPSIWNDFFENLTEQIEELKYNFSL